MNGLILSLPDLDWQAKAGQLHQVIAEQYFKLVTGLEREFYLSHALSDEQCAAILGKLDTSIIEEEGKHQYEYHVGPYASVAELIHANAKAEQYIIDVAGKHALFTSKPYTDQPSSSLHIHLHAEDANGKRSFYKHGEEMSDALRYSIAGLLIHIQEAAALLTQDNGVYYTGTEDHKATTISWGNNNRTTAIRLPDSDPDQKRIEYRIAPTDAPLEKLLAIIFASILDGLDTKPELPPAIYGNASDAQYNLTKLPQNLAEAEQVLTKNSKLRYLLT